jgi:hypothetical protein
MTKWPAFKIKDDVYDLTHLNSDIITISREATTTFPQRSHSVFLSFNDHCFTEHFNEDDDDDWVYHFSKGQVPRYFCKNRYECSKLLPNLLLNLINATYIY